MFIIESQLSYHTITFFSSLLFVTSGYAGPDRCDRNRPFEAHDRWARWIANTIAVAVAIASSWRVYGFDDPHTHIPEVTAPAVSDDPRMDGTLAKYSIFERLEQRNRKAVASHCYCFFAYRGFQLVVKESNFMKHNTIIILYHNCA